MVFVAAELILFKCVDMLHKLYSKMHCMITKGACPEFLDGELKAICIVAALYQLNMHSTK